MFRKKSCPRCGKNLRESYDFCPYCGNILARKQENLGMLGKNDSFEMNLDELKLPKGLNMIFNSLMRNLEKQFKDTDKKNVRPEDRRGNISISISTMGNKFPPVNVNPAQEEEKKKKHEDMKKFFFDNFKSERLKKFSKLPREEPKTTIRRFDNMLEYEVSLPGVKSVKDISILHLERGMELRAISDKKSYFKSIPVSLPISDFKLSKGKFVLKLDANGNSNHML